jgi:tetratricopeptide (TPR) repeat protein
MSVSLKALLLASSLVVSSCALVGAQSPDPQPTPAEPRGGQTEQATQANALYGSQNFVAALPLYEDLHKRHPRELMWDERLAMCLLGASQTYPDAQATAMRERAHQLLLEAKAAGDNSNLLQVVLEKMEAPAAATPARPPSSGMDAFQRAEKAFSSGDLPGALKLYEESAAADPKFYEAPLEAGDTEYKRGNYAEAGTWFARAIAIDPDRETAYRYWGDCLMKAGDPKRAEDKFIDAVIAEPYTRTTRVGLKQWADLTKMSLSSPQVTLPPRATVDAKGASSVTIDPASLGNPTSSAVLAYSIGSTVWRNGMFQKTYPGEKQYRHSLAEEAQSIRVALSSLAKTPPEKWDLTWNTLSALDKDGMLECWILLDHADQGIAQDYVAYRAAHRDLLHTYIAKYDIHPK